MISAMKLTVILILIGQVSCNLQDMTWVMDMDKISFHPVYDNPESKFVYKVLHAGPIATITFAAYNAYSTVEHMGTHMDAPYHFYKDGLTMDQVPLADLMGALVKIDISNKAIASPDAEVTLEDVMNWEEKYGRMPNKSFVLMYSGWDKYWGDNAKYIGATDDGNIHFPGFKGEASKWLVANRDIAGVGVDTVSCDPGIDHNVTSHLEILYKNKLCIENLKDVGKVPDCGARFMMLPIMMKGGTGTQGRAFAEWYQGVGYKTHCKSGLKQIDSFGDTGKAPSVVSSILLIISAVLYHVYFQHIAMD